MLRTFPNLAGYTADLAQTPGIAASINMRHIKVGVCLVGLLSPGGA